MDLFKHNLKGEPYLDMEAFQEACKKLVEFCDKTLDLDRQEGYVVLRAVTNGLADLLDIPESERLLKNSPARFKP